MNENIHIKKVSNFVVFKTKTGKVNIDVIFQDNTLWLTQKKMSELFEVNTPAISKHLKNIFSTGELAAEAVVSKLETTAQDNKTYKTKYYNLRAIQGIVMNMKDWITFLDKFLELSDYPILLHKGKITALEAKIKAEAEFDNYRVF